MWLFVFVMISFWSIYLWDVVSIMIPFFINMCIWICCCDGFILINIWVWYPSIMASPISILAYIYLYIYDQSSALLLPYWHLFYSMHIRLCLLSPCCLIYICLYLHMHLITLSLWYASLYLALTHKHVFNQVLCSRIPCLVFVLSNFHVWSHA